MKKLAQICISASILIACSSAFADGQKHYKGYKGEMAPPIQPVTIPTFPGGFEITLAALYLQPTSDNLGYASSEHEGVLVNSKTKNSFVTESIDPDYDFGFLLGIGYVIPNTANDVQLNWLHFKDSDKASKRFVAPDSGERFVETVPTFPTQFVGVTLSSEGDFANTHGKVSNELNTIDLHFGQYIDITPQLQTRLFAGLRYAEIERDLVSSYHSEFALTRLLSEEKNASVDSDSTFNGIGPLVGVTANYQVGYGFGVTGGIDVALLVGEIDFEQSSHTYSGAVSHTITNDNFDFDDTNVITPAFDAKLGVDYIYTMNNGMQFNIELGYLVSKYFDVIETAELSSTVPIETVNFGLNGPYLSVKATL